MFCTEFKYSHIYWDICLNLTSPPQARHNAHVCFHNHCQFSVISFWISIFLQSNLCIDGHTRDWLHWTGGLSVQVFILRCGLCCVGSVKGWWPHWTGGLWIQVASGSRWPLDPGGLWIQVAAVASLIVFSLTGRRNILTIFYNMFHLSPDILMEEFERIFRNFSYIKFKSSCMFGWWGWGSHLKLK